MFYKLRFVQYFDKRDSEVFLELEKKFIELEKRMDDMANGRRFVSIMGREPTNAMVWEADFPTLDASVQALKTIEATPEHDLLLAEQIRYMRDTYVEVYQEL